MKQAPKKKKALVALGLSLMVLPVEVAPAWAGPAATAIRCGQTVTASVRLTADLVNCPGGGLVIGVSGITLDLNGHTIGGTNAAGSEGIADDGHGGVAIINGTIRDFFVTGLALRHAPSSRVRNLTVRQIGAGGGPGDTSRGIALTDSAGARVEDSTVTNNVQSFESDGIFVKRSPGMLLEGNRFNQNSWTGLIVGDSPNSRILHNIANGNPNNGIHVTRSDSTVVIGNQADTNGNLGIVVGDMHLARVIGNSAAGNGLSGPDGWGLFFFDLHEGVIAGNLANRNMAGFLLTGGQFGSDHNRVIDNTASENSIVGLVIDTGADTNLAVGNVADGNQGAINIGGGIAVAGTGNRLVANVANGNVANGIDVVAPGNSLTANNANTNAGRGMDAGTGTLDGGGNRARGNVLQPQCVGIHCS